LYSIIIYALDEISENCYLTTAKIFTIQDV